MPRLLQIALLGHPCLRERSTEVSDPTDCVVQELIDDLIATMLHLGAVGLAAPQVDSSLRLFVMRSKKSVNYPIAPELDPFEVINPEVLRASDESERGFESCYSFPGYVAMVRRPKIITARWSDRSGKRIERELAGLAARVFLHELDHLNGVMYFSRLDSLNDLVAREEMHRIK